MIYFILAPEVDRVKIGKSKDVKARLKTLQTGHSQDLCLIMTVDADDSFEFELHERFKAYHVRGEWFQMSEEIADYILLTPEKWMYATQPQEGLKSAFACLERHHPGFINAIQEAIKLVCPELRL